VVYELWREDQVGAVEPDLEVLEQDVGQLDLGAPPSLIGQQSNRNDSVMAVVERSVTPAIESTTPEAVTRSENAWDSNCTPRPEWIAAAGAW
jgi:hypothetical protein